MYICVLHFSLNSLKFVCIHVYNNILLFGFTMIIYDMLICALSWGIFYGAFQNGIGCAGGILHISED